MGKTLETNSNMVGFLYKFEHKLVSNKTITLFALAFYGLIGGLPNITPRKS